MNTFSRVLLGIAVVVIILFTQFFLVRHYCPKIAFVRSDILLTEYIGMKEAKDAFTQKQRAWQANIDSLKNDIVKFKASKGVSQERISQMEQNLAEYTKKINAMAEDEDLKTTQTVYLQINAFIEEFGKKHGYTIIFGSGTSGTLLYGDNTIDITDELLDALNHNYNPSYAK